MNTIDQKFPYYSISTEETFKKTDSREKGLSNKEAKQRQEEYGKNVLPEKGGTSVIMLFLKQFKDFLILILFIAAGIAFWADQMADVYIILAVILFNAIMGFVQEYRAEKAIESIKNLVKKKAFVLREGKEKEIEAEEIVPGDIIVLKEGSTIPADGRLIKSKDLHTSEASLTGESMPIEKNTEEAREDLPLGDRTNSVFKATHVSRGTGKAIVTSIGQHTEIGKIATSMSEMKMQDSNFKKKTATLGKKMAAIAIFTASIVFLLGYFFREFDFQNILLVTIASLVSSIPEGLPVVISIVLAIGANRMAKKNAIIREFTATEMMGSVSTILSDKTGTITKSVLTVKKVFTGSGRQLDVGGSGYDLEGDFTSENEKVNVFDDPVESKLMVIGRFCNDASVEIPEGENNKQEEEEKKDDYMEVKVSGDPTEVAMLVMARKAKTLEQDRYRKISVIDDLPFNSEQKYRASLVEKEDENDRELFVIGAPERILEKCTHFL
ncbi:MAG: cation-translocating P-type ATPase, partial [Bacteroidales bacterium]